MLSIDSLWFANLNSPSSDERFVDAIVREFVLKPWPGTPDPHILDHGGTTAFRSRATRGPANRIDRLPEATVFRSVNPNTRVNPDYHDIKDVPSDFNAHLIMVFGTIEYYRTEAALTELLTQLFGLLRPCGVLLISETDPDRGVGAIPLVGGFARGFDNLLTEVKWRQGAVTRMLETIGYTGIVPKPELIPNIWWNPVWVLAAHRPPNGTANRR